MSPLSFGFLFVFICQVCFRFSLVSPVFCSSHLSCLFRFFIPRLFFPCLSILLIQFSVLFTLLFPPLSSLFNFPHSSPLFFTFYPVYYIFFCPFFFYFPFLKFMFFHIYFSHFSTSSISSGLIHRFSFFSKFVIISFSPFSSSLAQFLPFSSLSSSFSFALFPHFNFLAFSSPVFLPFLPLLRSFFLFPQSFSFSLSFFFM